MYLVLGVKKYDFQPDRGERLSGVKVTYVDQSENTPTHKGFPVMTVSGPVELFDQFSNLPGLYDLNFRQRPNSKGQPVLVLSSAKFINSVNIFAVDKKAV